MSLGNFKTGFNKPFPSVERKKTRGESNPVYSIVLTVSVVCMNAERKFFFLKILQLKITFLFMLQSKTVFERGIHILCLYHFILHV